MSPMQQTQTTTSGRPLCLWINTSVWSAGCALLIVLGTIGGECALSPKLPDFLIAVGAIHLVILLLEFVYRTDVPVNAQELLENEEAVPKAHPMKLLVNLLGLGGLVSYILGTIWTYPKASEYWKDPGTTCSPTIFLPSFIVITLFYAASIMGCGFCCLSPCILPIIAKRAAAKETPGAVANAV